MNNEYVTYGVFIVYNIILIFGTAFAFRKYNDIIRECDLIKKEQDTNASYIDSYIVKQQKKITDSVNDIKNMYNDYEINRVVENVKRLDEFYRDYELNEFGDKLKWMENIISKLENIDAAEKIEEHEELLDQLDIRDINDTISNLASEEYVNSELEDLQCNINEQSDRIDWLEKIIGGFRNVLNDKDL